MPEDLEHTRDAVEGTAPAQRSWLANVAGADVLMLLLGVWIAISPAVLDYHSGDASWNPVVFGLLVVLLALAGMTGAVAAGWAGWGAVAIGVWLFLSSFFLADSNVAEWNARGAGALLVFLAIASLGGPAGGSAGRRR